MLVISRKPGEVLFIGEARIVVKAICGNRVKLVIDAPREVRIWRDENGRSDESNIKPAK